MTAVAAVVAHIVGGGAVWPRWVTSAALFGGAVAAAPASGAVRRAWLTAAGAGLAATVVADALLPAAPSAPVGVSLRIAAPAAGTTVTSPVAVRVCDRGAAVPGAGRLLSISLDGRQIAEVGSDSAVVNAAAGSHTLRAEVVTSDHREYAPPVLTDELVTVSGPGTLGAVPECAP